MPVTRRNELPDFKNIGRDFKALERKLPRDVGKMLVNFSKDSWNREGFVDQGVEKWPARKKAGKGKRQSRRNLLVKTGELKRSVELKGTPSMDRIAIGTDVSYAQIHNEGGVINETVRVRTHTRKVTRRFFAKSQSLKTRKISVKRVRQKGTTQVKAHTRDVYLKMPKRQFMGPSRFFDKRLELHMDKNFKTILG